MKTILLFNEIGEWGTTPADFKSELDSANGEDVIIRINSPGGNVFDGLTIHNMLKNYSGKTTSIIDGIAASITSVIALGSDEVIMNSGAFFMIHNPHVVIGGEADDLREQADLMDKIKAQMVDIYKNATGLEEEEIISMMDETTYLSSEESIEKGFATSLGEGLKIAANLNVSKEYNILFNNIPKELTMKKKKDVQTEVVEKPEVSVENSAETLAVEETPSDEVVKAEAPVETGETETEIEVEEEIAEIEAKLYSQSEVDEQIKNALVMEASRQDEIRALAFDGQDTLVMELIKEGVSVDDASKRIITNAKTLNVVAKVETNDAGNALADLMNSAPKSLATENETESGKSEIDVLRAKAEKLTDPKARLEITKQITKLKKAS